MLSTAIFRPFEDVLALERLVDLVLRAPDDDFVPVRDVVHQRFPETHDLRHQLARAHIGHERQHDHAERRLHRRVLVQLVEHHARDGVALELDHDAGRVARFVAQVADALELLFAHELRDALHQLGAVHLVRDFGDHDLRPSGRLLLLDHGAGAHDDLAASRLLVVLDAGTTVDERAGREVRARYQLGQLLDRGFRIVDERQRGGDDFAQVVRRNVRRHADGDA